MDVSAQTVLWEAFARKGRCRATFVLRVISVLPLSRQWPARLEHFALQDQLWRSYALPDPFAPPRRFSRRVPLTLIVLKVLLLLLPVLHITSRLRGQAYFRIVFWFVLQIITVFRMSLIRAQQTRFLLWGPRLFLTAHAPILSSPSSTTDAPAP